MEGPNQELETDRTTFPATPHQKQSSTLTNETAIISMMTSMTSLVKQVLDKDQKEDVSRKTLEQYSAKRSFSESIDISSTTSPYGIHPELLKTLTTRAVQI